MCVKDFGNIAKQLSVQMNQIETVFSALLLPLIDHLWLSMQLQAPTENYSNFQYFAFTNWLNFETIRQARDFM